MKFEDNTFRYIPWTLLMQTKKREGISQYGKLLYEILLRNRNKHGICKLKNHEILSKMDISWKTKKRKSIDQLEKTFNSLEKIKYIERQQKGPIREIIVYTKYEDTGLGLMVPPEIFLDSDLSWPRKLVISYDIYKPKQTPTTVSKFLGISDNTVLYHREKIIKNGEYKKIKDKIVKRLALLNQDVLGLTQEGLALKTQDNHNDNYYFKLLENLNFLCLTPAEIEPYPRGNRTNTPAETESYYNSPIIDCEKRIVSRETIHASEDRSAIPDGIDAVIHLDKIKQPPFVTNNGSYATIEENSNNKKHIPFESSLEGNGQVGNIIDNSNNSDLEKNHMTSSQILTLRKKSNITEKPKKKQKNISTKPCADLTWISNNCPYLSKQVIGKKSYLDSAKVARGLANGLITEFKEEEQEILDKAEAAGVGRNTARSLFRKKFTIQERVELYRRLNLLQDPAYFRKTKNGLPKNLAAALGQGNRFVKKSFLFWVMVKEPQRLNRTAIYSVEREIDIVNHKWWDNSINQKELERVIMNLHSHYDKIDKAESEEFLFWNAWDTWPKFFHRFVDFIEDQYGFKIGKMDIDKLSAGWFKYWNKPYKNFMEDIKKDIKQFEKMEREEERYQKMREEEYRILNQKMVEEESWDLRLP